MIPFAAHFEFLPEHQLIRIRLSGRFALAEVERARSALTLHQDFDPKFRRCYDVRSVQGIPEVPRSAGGFLADFIAFDPIVARRALVATPEVVARFAPFAALADPALFRIFTDPAPAEKWLLAE